MLGFVNIKRFSEKMEEDYSYYWIFDDLVVYCSNMSEVKKVEKLLKELFLERIKQHKQGMKVIRDE